MRVKIRKKSFGKLESFEKKKTLTFPANLTQCGEFKNFLPLTFYVKSMAVSSSQLVKKIDFT